MNSLKLFTHRRLSLESQGTVVAHLLIGPVIPGPLSSASNTVDVLTKHSYLLTIGGEHMKILIPIVCMRANDEQNSF